MPAAPAHNGTTPVVAAGEALLAASSTLSLVGDLGIIVVFFSSPIPRSHTTIRIIAFLAIADLIGELPIVGSLSLPGPPVSSWPGPIPWCQVQAIGNWYAQLSTWLWTCCYAHHVAAGATTLFCFRPLRERYFHMLCWGLPALAVGVAASVGMLGVPDDGSPQCTVKNSGWSMTFYSVLWGALAYNALVFFLVHSSMYRILSANALTLAPDAAESMRRRLDALGSRFRLYLLTFLGSQLPCALRHVLVAALGDPATWASPVFWDGLTLLACFLCPLHGALNGLVYGWSARHKISCKAEDMAPCSSCSSCCCGEEDEEEPHEELDPDHGGACMCGRRGCHWRCGTARRCCHCAPEGGACLWLRSCACLRSARSGTTDADSSEQRSSLRHSLVTSPVG
jgi:hypothetical protein